MLLLLSFSGRGKENAEVVFNELQLLKVCLKCKISFQMCIHA